MRSFFTKPFHSVARDDILLGHPIPSLPRAHQLERIHVP